MKCSAVFAGKILYPETYTARKVTSDRDGTKEQWHIQNLFHTEHLSSQKEEKTALMLSFTLHRLVWEGDGGGVKGGGNHFILKTVQNWLVYSSRLFECVLPAGGRDPLPPSLAISSLQTRKASSSSVVSWAGGGGGPLLGLLLHGVPDSPPLTRAGLQHQQVAEVDVGWHHLQAASAGSADDGLVLRGGGVGDQRKC